MHRLDEDYSQEEAFVNFFTGKKKTRIEGFVIEEDFYKSFIDPLSSLGYRFSEGLFVTQWWKNRFHILPDNKTALTIAKMLLERDISCLRLKVSGGKVLCMSEDKEVSQLTYHASEKLSPRIRASTAREVSELYDLRRKDPEWCRTVVRDVILKDNYLDKYIVDIDFFMLTPSGKLIHLEIKHKYPSPRTEALHINKSEEKLCSYLLRKGIPTIHLILCKPIWNPNQKSTYLLTNSTAREKAVWLATVLNPESSYLDEDMAPARTALGGDNKGVNTWILDMTRFRMLGSLSDGPAILSEQFTSYLNKDRRKKLPTVSYKQLDSMRIDKIITGANPNLPISE